MFAVLVWAAIEDVRTRRIRNTLTLTLALAGIAQSFWLVGTVSPVGSVLGLLVGFTLGRSAPYAESLRFDVPEGGTEDPDEAIAGGAMIRQSVGKVKDLLTGS